MHDPQLGSSATCPYGSATHLNADGKFRSKRVAQSEYSSNVFFSKMKFTEYYFQSCCASQMLLRALPARTMAPHVGVDVSWIKIMFSCHDMRQNAGQVDSAVLSWVSLIHLEARRTQGHKKQCKNVTNAIQLVNQNTIEYYWMGWKCLVVPWKQEMHLRASEFATCATRKQEIDGIQTSRKSFWHLERPPRWRRVRHHRLQRRCHLAEWQKGIPW